MPSLFPPPPAGVARVWILPLDAPPLAPGLLASTLAADERARAARFVFERDRRRYTTARGLLRTVLGTALGCGASDVALTEGPNGRPMLAHAAPLAFNLSHSGEWVAIALATGDASLPLGVDIELARPIDDLMAVAGQVFVASELAALSACPTEADRTAVFHRLWTRKEACMKATGAGFSLPPQTLEVDAFRAVQAVTLPPHALAPDGLSVRVHDVSGADGCAGALAIGGGDWKVDVRVVRNSP